MMFMRMTVANNITTSLPEATTVKKFMKNVENRFRTADKSLAGTLMSKLTTMSYDGTREMNEHILEITNLAAKL